MLRLTEFHYLENTFKLLLSQLARKGFIAELASSKHPEAHDPKLSGNENYFLMSGLFSCFKYLKGSNQQL